MAKPLKQLVLALVAVAVLGGFVGGELTDRTFSITGATVAAVVVAVVLLGLGAFFYSQEQRKKKADIPPEIRGVFDRMLGGSLERAETPNQRERERQSLDRVQLLITTASRILTPQLLPDHASIEPHHAYARVLNEVSTFMTNREARSYLHGLHIGLLSKIFKDAEHEAALATKFNYERLFGKTAGPALLKRTLESGVQVDASFTSGLDDAAAYLDARQQPDGLARILGRGQHTPGAPIATSTTADPVRRAKEAFRQIEAAGDVPGIEYVGKRVLALLADREKTTVSIVEEGMDPRVLVYLLITNVGWEELSTGKHHVYRGVLNFVGEQVLKSFVAASRKMVEHGRHDQQAHERELADLRRQIKEAG